MRRGAAATAAAAVHNRWLAKLAYKIELNYIESWIKLHLICIVVAPFFYIFGNRLDVLGVMSSNNLKLELWVSKERVMLLLASP